MERGYDLIVYFHSQNQGNHVNHPGNPGLDKEAQECVAGTGVGGEPGDVHRLPVSIRLYNYLFIETFDLVVATDNYSVILPGNRHQDPIHRIRVGPDQFQ